MLGKHANNQGPSLSHKILVNVYEKNSILLKIRIVVHIINLKITSEISKEREGVHQDTESKTERERMTERGTG